MWGRLGGLRGAAALAPALLVVAALALIFGVFQYSLASVAPAHSPEYRVAVAAFVSATSGAPAADGREVAGRLAREMRRRVEARGDLNGRVAVVTVPAISDQRQAANIALESGADIVIWGRINEASDTYSPSIYLAEQTGGQLWYGDLPAWREPTLASNGSGTLGPAKTSATTPLATYVLGLIYLQHGNYSGAAAQFQETIERAVESRPLAAETLATFHLALGRARAGLGDFDTARREYLAALEYDTDRAAAYVGLGNIEYSAGACEAALRKYASALLLAPYSPDVLYSRGNAYYCLARYQEAARDYREAARIAQIEGEPEGWYQLVLGVALCRSGEFEDGITQFAAARSGNPASAAQLETENCLKLAGEPGAGDAEVVQDVIAALWPTPTSPAPDDALAVWRGLPFLRETDMTRPVSGLTLLMSSPSATSAPASATSRPTVTRAVSPSSTPELMPTDPPSREPERDRDTLPTATRAAVPTRIIPTSTAVPLPPARIPAATATRTEEPSATPVSPTETAMSAPSATLTPLPPTATALPPTATPLPPTATPLPPTATPLPPTATEAPPPTSTPVPPTDIPAPTPTEAPEETPTSAPEPTKQPPPGHQKKPTKTPKVP
jgi:tetratricopeptide (TPR) repeat protein